LSIYDPFEQQRRTLRMFQPFNPVSKKLRMQSQPMRVASPVTNALRLQERGVGMTPAIARDHARGMSPATVQNNVAGHAARAMTGHGLERVRRVHDIGISAPRHHALRSMRATAALSDADPVGKMLERMPRPPRWSVSSRASRELGDPYGVREVFGARDVFDAARSSRSAYAQCEHQHRRDLATSRQASRAVRNATEVLHDIQRLPLALAVPTTALAAHGGSPLLSERDRARLRSAERDLAQAAMVMALNPRWARTVESTLLKVWRAQRQDSAAGRASSTLFDVRRLRAPRLPSRGLTGTYSFVDPAAVLRNSPLYVVDRYLARDVFRASAYGSPDLLEAVDAAMDEMAAEFAERGWRVSEDAPAVAPVEETLGRTTDLDSHELVMEALATLVALYTSAQAQSADLLRAGGGWTELQAQRMLRAVEVAFDSSSLAVEHTERWVKEWAWDVPLWPYARYLAIKPYLDPARVRDVRDPFAEAVVGVAASGVASWVFSMSSNEATGVALALTIAGSFVKGNSCYRRIEAFDQQLGWPRRDR
jgi:hypothetical protein